MKLPSSSNNFLNALFLTLTGDLAGSNILRCSLLVGARLLVRIWRGERSIEATLSDDYLEGSAPALESLSFLYFYSERILFKSNWLCGRILLLGDTLSNC